MARIKPKGSQKTNDDNLDPTEPRGLFGFSLNTIAESQKPGW